MSGYTAIESDRSRVVGSTGMGRVFVARDVDFSGVYALRTRAAG